MEETGAFDKLHSDVSYGSIGHEFNVYESTVYIIQGVFKQKNTHRTKLCID